MAGGRVVDSVAAALSDYGIGEVETVHAIRTMRSVIHGFVLLEQDEGFQYKEDTGDTLNWMIEFFDRGLRAGRPHWLNSFHCPSETTSTAPSTTATAVWSSTAYAGTGSRAAHFSA